MTGGPADRLQAALEALDARLPRPEQFPHRARGRWLTARAGTALGVCFVVCFVTGVWSHVLQHPPYGFVPPSRPWWGYALTQGVHVTTGMASIPLLVVKLWSVAPRFWRRPLLPSSLRPTRSALRHGIERVSVLVLVASAVFELVTGVLNVAQAYVFPFFFPAVHFAVAWLAVGSMVLHLAVQWPAIRGGWRLREARRLTDQARGGLTRRGVLGLGLVGSAAAVLTTVGDKIPVLSQISVFSQRSQRGPQGLPVNGLAVWAGIDGAGLAERWRLQLVGPAGQVVLDLAALQGMTQVTVRLPIACVEGWSVAADWTGVRLADLAGLVGGGTRAVVSSPDPGLYGRSEVGPAAFADPDTLIALQLNGEPLALDHGFPARLIAPHRPGALQTKWLDRIEVVR